MEGWKSKLEERGVKVNLSDDDLLIYFKLVKSGYGSFEEVKEMNVREVIQALYYESFLTDYQNSFVGGKN